MDNLYVLSVKIPGTGYLREESFNFPHFSCNFLVLTALERFEPATDPSAEELVSSSWRNYCLKELPYLRSITL